MRRSGKASIQTKLVLPGTNRDSLLGSNVSWTHCPRKQRNSQQQCKKKGRERDFIWYFSFYFGKTSYM